MPAQVIEQGLATPGLLAHVAVQKFCDHMPLARQEKFFARHGIELPRSTLTDWKLSIGQATTPLVERMGEWLKRGEILASDDTPWPWQNGRAGKTTHARLWVWRGRVEERKQLRQERAPPLLAALKTRLEAHLPKLPPKGPLAEAIGYTLNHWTALNRYLDEGRLEIDNNAIERSIRPVAQGRANWLFVASERGGHAAAALYSLIESAKANGLNPYAYLRDVLTRLPLTKAKDIDSLLPHLWQLTA